MSHVYHKSTQSSWRLLMRAWCCFTASAFAFMAFCHSVTAAPLGVAYFGELTHDTGAPYTGVVSSVSARLYDASSAGNELWSALIGDVAVLHGHFQVVLGTASNPLDAALSGQSELWLEFRFGATPMVPRQQVLSVPFARVAANAESLGGHAASVYALKSYVDSAPARATSKPTAPGSPTNGELWFDTSSGSLRIYDTGSWEPISGAPSQRLGDVSNGALTNAFAAVDGASSATPVDVIGGDASGASITSTFSEHAATVVDELMVSVHLDALEASSLQVELTPPGGSAVSLPVPVDPAGVGSHTWSWYSSTTPELEALIGAAADGTWTITVTDAGPGSIGVPIAHVTSALVSCGLSRADQVFAQGKIEVAGDLDAGGRISAGQGVQVGYTSHACGPASEGTLRWVAATHSLEVCNGTAWGAIGIGGGSSGSYLSSCQAIRDAGSSQGDGMYWIDPDGGSTINAFAVHCVMSVDGGGWTKVMYFPSPRSLSSAAITPGNLTSLTGIGKLDDATIQLLGGSRMEMLAVYPADASKWVKVDWGNSFAFHDNPGQQSYCQNLPGGGTVSHWDGSTQQATYSSGTNTSSYCYSAVGGIDLQNDGDGESNAQTVGVSQQPFAIYVRSAPLHTFRASCLDLKDSGVGPTTGTYWVDPDGGSPLAPVQVYCDQLTDTGGWTKIMYFSSPRALTSNAVTPTGVATFGGVGKLSDATINALMTGNHQMLAVYPADPSKWVRATWGSNWQFADNPGTSTAKCQNYTNGGPLLYHTGLTRTATYTDSNMLSNYCWFGSDGGIDLQNDGNGESNASTVTVSQQPFVMFVR